jgi:hypothetical protein
MRGLMFRRGMRRERTLSIGRWVRAVVLDVEFHFFGRWIPFLFLKWKERDGGGGDQ